MKCKETLPQHADKGEGEKGKRKEGGAEKQKTDVGERDTRKKGRVNE